MSQASGQCYPPSAIAHVARHIAGGGLVILPTDTVYGIGALASDAGAVERLLAAKGRGRQMPPPVLVATPDQVVPLVAGVPEAARILMDRLWPGALTLILDAAPNLGWDLGETGGTLALRMPDHPLALELLRTTGPLAVTSANHTGEPPATSAVSARLAFPGRVTDIRDIPGISDAEAWVGGNASLPAEPAWDVDIALLDGGATGGPVPSTIISLAGDFADSPHVIRDGLLSREQIAQALAGVRGLDLGELHTGGAA